MTHILTVRDFRGCERADITIAPLALIAGHNGAGKSSILLAAGAALSGQPLPVKIAKKDAGWLVKTGSDKGRVSLSGGGDDNEAFVRWPAAEYGTRGKAPKGSIYAAGIASVLDLDDKERAKVFAHYLKSDPTMADLAADLRDSGAPFVAGGVATEEGAAAMKALGLNGMDQRDVAIFRQATATWREIEAQGWDAAHKLASEAGAKLKGRWEQVSKSKYGSTKAADWRPENWTETLGQQTEEALQTAVTTAKAAHEKAVAATAVAGDRLAQLAAAGEAEPATKAAYEAAKTAHAAATKSHSSINDRIKVVQSSAPSGIAPCPHCKSQVSVKQNGTRYDLVAAPSEAEQIAAAEELKNLHAAAVAAESVMTARQKDMATAWTAHETAARAATELASLKKAFAIPSGEGETADTAGAVALAESRIKAFQAKRDADRLHRAILVQIAVVKALAPDGLRKRRTSRAVEAFNDSLLAPLCVAANWKPVALTEDLATTYGGRPYPLLSMSEQFRVRVAMQVAMARIDGSALVIIDGADILDAPGRKGLFDLLLADGRPALIGMTLLSAAKMPSLDAAGIGASYWIESGVCRPLVEGGELRKDAA